MLETPRQIADGPGSDAMIAAGKSTLPVAVTALSIGGVGLEDWVFILTAVYLVLQIGYLVWKWMRALRGSKVPADG